MTYEPKKLTLPRLGRRVIRKGGPYDGGARCLIELAGDDYYARELVVAAAREYVRRLRCAD